MTETSEVASELNNIEKIIDAILNLDTKIKDALWRRKARAILGRLRDLYFHEAGTLGFLRHVSSGDTVPPEMINNVSSHFYRSDEIVADALDDLRKRCDFNDIRLTIEDANLMAEIINDKTRVRESIRTIFHSLENGRAAEVHRNRAQAICERIEHLNAKFVEADARFRAKI